MMETVNKEIEENYWNDYYGEGVAPSFPSSFASLVVNKIDPNKWLIDLGCGNGRDSLFFANNNINTFAIDSSKNTIQNNQKNILKSSETKLIFEVGDFMELSNVDNLPPSIGTIYSRFTLHSVNQEGYYQTINEAYKALDSNGLFLIEVRSVNDPLCGQGKNCGDNGFISTHYRRFIEMREILADLQNYNFSIEMAQEDYLSSWYKEDKAVVIRIIARRNE